MTQLSRRTLLGSTAGLLGFAAGCLDEGEPSATSDDDSGSNSESDTIGSGGDVIETHDTHSFQRPDVPTKPTATLLASTDRAEDWLEDREIDDSLAEFVDDTAFEESVLVSAEADAPNLCYEMTLDELTVENPDADDAHLSLEARVSNESDELCGQQLTTVGQLVRVTFADDPVTSASVLIVDQDEQEHELTVDRENESASAADSETEYEAESNGRAEGSG